MRRISWLTGLLVLASCSGPSATTEDAVAPSTTAAVSVPQVDSETGDENGTDSATETAPPLLANQDAAIEDGAGGDVEQFCSDMQDLANGGVREPVQLYAAYDRMALNAPAEIHDEVQEYVRLSRLTSEAIEPHLDDPEAMRLAFAGLEPAAIEMVTELAEASRTGEFGTGPASVTIGWMLNNCDSD